MYLDKLAPGGIIIVNVANKYLDFKPVFGNLADDLGLASMLGVSFDDWEFPPGDVTDLYACEWVLLARKKEDFGLLNAFDGGWHNHGRWSSLPRQPELGVWTDCFSNLLSVFDWSLRDRPD